jgi:hypothetical protein
VVDVPGADERIHTLPCLSTTKSVEIVYSLAKAVGIEDERNYSLFVQHKGIKRAISYGQTVADQLFKVSPLNYLFVLLSIDYSHILAIFKYLS